MSISIDVALLSGKSVSLPAGLDEPVNSLRQRAQALLAVGRGRLLDSSGAVLDGAASVKKAKLQHGDALTLQLGHVRVAAAQRRDYSDYPRLGDAFAAILGDGTVETWGNAAFGVSSLPCPVVAFNLLF